MGQPMGVMAQEDAFSLYTPVSKTEDLSLRSNQGCPEEFGVECGGGGGGWLP